MNSAQIIALFSLLVSLVLGRNFTFVFSQNDCENKALSFTTYKKRCLFSKI